MENLINYLLVGYLMLSLVAVIAGAGINVVLWKKLIKADEPLVMKYKESDVL